MKYYALLVIFKKAANQNLKSRLLQIKGGALRVKDLSVTCGNATEQEDVITKIKCYVVKRLQSFL